MKFVNLGEKPLKFDLGGAWYECAVAGEVDIPERVAFCVALHGIPLTPAAEVEPAKAAPAIVAPGPELAPDLGNAKPAKKK